MAGPGTIERPLADDWRRWLLNHSNSKVVYFQFLPME